MLCSAAAPEQAGFGIGFAIALPFIYAIGGLIFVPLACLIFNFVAKLVGGLEFAVTESQQRLGRPLGAARSATIRPS